MKKGRKVRFLLISMGVILILLIALSVKQHNEVYVTSEPIRIENYEFHQTNTMQHNASVIMDVFDGELYFYSGSYSSGQDRTMYYKHIAVFRNGKAPRLIRPIGFPRVAVGQYWVFSTFLNTYRYDLSSKQFSKILDGANMYFHVSGNNAVYLAEFEEGPYDYFVGSEWIGQTTQQPDVYHLNGWSYWLEGTFQRDFVRRDASGQKESLNELYPFSQERKLLLCNQGIILINDSYGNLLYLIPNGSDESILLFPEFDSITTNAAIALHEDTIYLSFMRYAAWGENRKGMVRQENDTLEGTYRISLIDYSVEKLSDEIYNGLYIFDDTGIYACDKNCNIYKLDFDGQRILTLLEKK